MRKSPGLPELKKTVLIVDDVPDSIVVLKEVLKADYRIKIATSGEEGLKIARAAPHPDLILLDISMPGMDGFETCRRIKQDEEGSTIPVIFMSATDRTTTEQEGFVVGAVDFIAKPIDPDVVRSRIKVHLEMREDNLRASEIKYRRLFETAQDGILIIDLQSNRIIDINPALAKLLETSPDEYLGMKTFELASQDAIACILPDQPVHDFQIYNTTVIKYVTSKAGKSLAVEVVRTVYRVNHRDIMQCNVRDITQRKQAEDEILRLNSELEQRVADRTRELEYANKELESFSYSVSHDLRAPLRTIDGYSAMLAEDFSGILGDKGLGFLDEIRAGVQHMGSLISALLSLSRYTRSDFRKQVVDMQALVKSIVEKITETEADGELEITMDELPAVHGDSLLLYQVWTNLIMNAVKFTKPRSERRISIKGLCEANFTIFSVQDNGVGFNPAYAHKLFGVFQRLHSTSDFAGTGIGLSIVERIVRRHGGTVWAEGEEGAGATFYFSLPAEGSALPS